jgi:hypothetical protein
MGAESDGYTPSISLSILSINSTILFNLDGSIGTSRHSPQGQSGLFLAKFSLFFGRRFSDD